MIRGQDDESRAFPPRRPILIFAAMALTPQHAPDAIIAIAKLPL
jgi:hypothetical protein